MPQNLSRSSIVALLTGTCLFMASLCYAQTPEKKIPFTPIGDLSLTTGTDWLDKYYRDKITDSVQIVGLGEVSHGSYEPIAFKNKMMQYLIEKKGYRNILLEQSDFYFKTIGSYLIDNKVNDNTIREWIERNKVTFAIERSHTELFNWIKKYNMAHPKDMVRIQGYDLNRSRDLLDHILCTYMIPTDPKAAKHYIYQSQNVSDTANAVNIRKWISTNKTKLIIQFGKKQVDRLNVWMTALDRELDRKRIEAYNVNGGVAAMLYRDSIMAVNAVAMIGQAKTIVSGHNGHIAGANPKFMGEFMKKRYGDRYYIVLTDFSRTAEAEVTSATQKDQNFKKNFTPMPYTAPLEIAEMFGIKSGIFTHKDIVQHRILDRTNTIDSGGLQVRALAGPRSFNSLVVFDTITVNGNLKP